MSLMKQLILIPLVPWVVSVVFTQYYEALMILGSVKADAQEQLISIWT